MLAGTDNSRTVDLVVHKDMLELAAVLARSKNPGKPRLEKWGDECGTGPSLLSAAVSSLTRPCRSLLWQRWMDRNPSTPDANSNSTSDLFEAYLKWHLLKYRHEPEVGSSRPDFEVLTGRTTFLAEVSEIGVPDYLSGDKVAMYEWVKTRVRDKAKQHKSVPPKTPFVVVLRALQEPTDRWPRGRDLHLHPSFFGETLLHPPKVVLTADRNTKVSAVVEVVRVEEAVSVTRGLPTPPPVRVVVYHNPHAQAPLPRPTLTGSLDQQFSLDANSRSVTMSFLGKKRYDYVSYEYEDRNELIALETVRRGYVATEGGACEHCVAKAMSEHLEVRHWRFSEESLAWVAHQLCHVATRAQSEHPRL